MIFEHTRVVTLRRRTDRLEAFKARWGGDEVGIPVPFDGTDGSVARPPTWWRQGRGAWGCYQSHLRIIDQALREGWDRVLIVEDDMIWHHDAVERINETLEAAGDDWDMLYLGGQHLKDPIPHKSGHWQCRNINRTHAYVVNGRALGRLYTHLADVRGFIAHPQHHVDHHMGELHQQSDFTVLAPIYWIAGQAPGTSDIGRTMTRPMFWNSWALQDSHPFFWAADGTDGLTDCGAYIRKYTPGGRRSLFNHCQGLVRKSLDHGTVAVALGMPFEDVQEVWPSVQKWTGTLPYDVRTMFYSGDENALRIP